MFIVIITLGYVKLVWNLKQTQKFSIQAVSRCRRLIFIASRLRHVF